MWLNFEIFWHGFLCHLVPTTPISSYKVFIEIHLARNLQQLCNNSLLTCGAYVVNVQIFVFIPTDPPFIFLSWLTFLRPWNIVQGPCIQFETNGGQDWRKVLVILKKGKGIKIDADTNKFPSSCLNAKVTQSVCYSTWIGLPW